MTIARRSHPLRTTVLGVLLAVSALVPMAATSASAADGDLGERLRVACLRIPVAQTRVSAVITRLESGPEVQGSLAWIRFRIAEATAANRPRVVQDLQHRLDVLTTKLDVLRGQALRLARAADHCRSRGVPL